MVSSFYLDSRSKDIGPYFTFHNYILIVFHSKKASNINLRVMVLHRKSSKQCIQMCINLIIH